MGNEPATTLASGTKSKIGPWAATLSLLRKFNARQEAEAARTSGVEVRIAAMEGRIAAIEAQSNAKGR